MIFELMILLVKALASASLVLAAAAAHGFDGHLPRPDVVDPASPVGGVDVAPQAQSPAPDDEAARRNSAPLDGGD